MPHIGYAFESHEYYGGVTFSALHDVEELFGGKDLLIELYLFFFFQAEDGIRDIGVTGVQTCALPISIRPPTLSPSPVSTASGAPRRRFSRSARLRLSVTSTANDWSVRPTGSRAP